jgi:hypothetical protein
MADHRVRDLREASAHAALRYVAHWRSERASKAAASGDDRPGPISATGRAGGCQTSTVIVPPRSAFVGGLGS